MSENKKKQLVPRLRFPEFREAAEWACAPLGRLFSERQEVGFTNLPLLSLMDKEGIIPQEDTNRKNNSSADKSKYLRVVPGDIAYNTMRMWEGRSAYAGLEGLISPAYTVCVPGDGINGIYFSYQFKTASLIREFRRYSQGLVKDTLNLKFETFSRIEIPYPVDAQEQQKIAGCLSSLDNLIAAETQKLDTLKTYKEGLMQQLFTREGETVPRLRFPEFRETGEWEKVSLQRVIEIASGQVDPTKPPYCDLPHVGGENIEAGTGKLLNLRTAKEDGVISGKYAFDEHDILYSKIRPALNKVAAPDISGVCSADVYPIRPCCEMLRREFLVYLLRSESFVKYATKHSGRGKIPKINREDLFAYDAMLPTPAEQEYIASFLSSLDERINLQSQKLEDLQSHKIGLMQQLFPALDEVDA